MNASRHLNLYGGSLALLTDLYQLTMSYGYWQQGRKDDEAIFHMFFRKTPFEGGYALAAGLGTFVEYLEGFHFSESDLEYLATLEGNDGKPLFHKDYLQFLEEMELRCDIDALPEGTPVFPQAPMVRVRGPLIQCQLLETALLTILNFQTLIATKSARICEAAEGGEVLEFGLRRAQGPDGGISAARAAIIGGAEATSNVLAGKLLGLPVKGTHAHSWVMSFDSELEAFESYAQAMPNNAVFLVDTFDTLEGVKKAVTVGKNLRERGHEMLGIRLDSGDLAYLSIEARKILDKGGFRDAKIVASNNLDEYTIESLHRQGAKIDIWGVGTNLATGGDQPALGGVYKLGAIKKPGQPWKPSLKLSEQRAKISNPGCLQVRRFYSKNYALGDMIFNELHGKPVDGIIVDPLDDLRRKEIDLENSTTRDLLQPIYREGTLVDEEILHTPLTEIRERARGELSRLHQTIRRFTNPHEYPIGLSQSLNRERRTLVLQARNIEE